MLVSVVIYYQVRDDVFGERLQVMPKLPDGEMPASLTQLNLLSIGSHLLLMIWKFSVCLDVNIMSPLNVTKVMLLLIIYFMVKKAL